MAKRWFSGKTVQVGMSLFLLLGLLLAACRPAATPTPTPAPTPRVTPAPGATPTPAPTPTAAPTPKPKPLRIGFLSSYLAGIAELTGDWRAGMEMAIEDVSGGTGEILGRKVEIIFRETENSAEVALRRARELVEEVGVTALVGIPTSAEALAISGYARENKVIYMDMGSLSAKLTLEFGHRYFFRVSPHNAGIVKGWVEYLKDKPYKRFGLLMTDYEFGWDMAERLKKAIPEAIPGGEIVVEVYIPWGEADQRPHITLLLAAKPEVVFSTLWQDDGVTFFKQAGPLGFFDKVVLAHSVGMWEIIWSPSGMDLPDGVLGGASYYFLAEDSPENRRFIERYHVKTGIERGPGPISYYGYQGMQFLLEAMKKAGTADTEAVIDAMEGMTLVDIIGKRVTMDAYEHQLAGPQWFGRAVTSPDYPKFKIFTDLVFIPGEKLMVPTEEVRRLRGE